MFKTLKYVNHRFASTQALHIDLSRKRISVFCSCDSRVGQYLCLVTPESETKLCLKKNMKEFSTVNPPDALISRVSLLNLVNWNFPVF